jgi:hypothetical protein
MRCAVARRLGATGLPLLLVVLGWPATAWAQAEDAPGLRPHHFTIGAGLVWSGAYGIGGSTAELRGNATGPTAPPFTLFDADAQVSPATAPELRVGFAVTRRLAIEAGASLGHPRVRVSISNDAEAPAQQLPGEELEQYQFDAAATWQLPIPMGRRFAPFVIGGGGHLRQLHEDRTLAETGQFYYAGGGAKYWWRGGSATSKAIGLRGDVRVNVRRKGIDFDDKLRAYPTLSLSLFVGL